jgi:ATP-dependent DNA helicase RecG
VPDYLDDKQRKKKIENLLQEMKKETITNIGSNKASKWVKSG